MKLRMDSAAAEESPIRRFVEDTAAVYGAIPPELQRILPHFSQCYVSGTQEVEREARETAAIFIA